MLCFPNCKINIGLYITRKRDDGYHDLETIFYPLQQHDVLEVIRGETTKLHLSGLAVAGNEKDNLVWKAYQLVKERFPGEIPDFDIYLQKAIPMGAGLGGGSADGAYMLRLLNDECKLDMDMEQLSALALRLGSDCPFFIQNKPCFAAGRGELLGDIPLDLSGYSIQVVCPDVHVSTGKAFAMLQSKPPGFDLRKLGELPIEEWPMHISNDFEGPVFSQFPVLRRIKELLYEQGAMYASMSGSGSAIYGIFRKSEKAEIGPDIAASVFYLD